MDHIVFDVTKSHINLGRNAHVFEWAIALSLREEGFEGVAVLNSGICITLDNNDFLFRYSKRLARWLRKLIKDDDFGIFRNRSPIRISLDFDKELASIVHKRWFLK